MDTTCGLLIYPLSDWTMIRRSAPPSCWMLISRSRSRTNLSNFSPTRSAGCCLGSSGRQVRACRVRVVYRCGRDRCVESHNRAAIFMDQGKRRASNVISFGRLKAFGNAFDHSGLPCSQVAAQQHDGSGLEFVGKPAAQFGCLFSRMGLKVFIVGDT